MLTFIICFLGIYLYGYINHCQEVDRQMAILHQDALLEDHKRTERKIKKAHSKNGHVFNEDK